MNVKKCSFIISNNFYIKYLLTLQSLKGNMSELILKQLQIELMENHIKTNTFLVKLNNHIFNLF